MAPYAFSDASQNAWISILGEEFDSQKYHRGFWIRAKSDNPFTTDDHS
jgi:hypothetical protein